MMMSGSLCPAGIRTSRDVVSWQRMHGGGVGISRIRDLILRLIRDRGMLLAVHRTGIARNPDPVSLRCSLVQCPCNFEKGVALVGGFCLFGPNQALMRVCAELF